MRRPLLGSVCTMCRRQSCASRNCVAIPELEDTIGVVTPAYEYHPVPNPEVVDTRDYEHTSWGVLLEVLVLDS